MKKQLTIVMALFAIALSGVLLSCPDGNKQNNNPGKKDSTFIVFDNTQGICPVTVFDDYRRRGDDAVALIPAGKLSPEIEWRPGDSTPFYFTYHIGLRGIGDFSIDYIPDFGKDQTAVRIDAHTATNINIPRLDETLSSQGQILSKSSYILIQNNSSYSFQLHRGVYLLNPDNLPDSAVVNAGERAQYSINPGAVSNYRLFVRGEYIAFSGSLNSFEAGTVYSFVFDGAVSLVSETEIMLKNVAGLSPNAPVPAAPGAPIVTALDSLLILRWTAVQGADSYEVYVSNGQVPPSLPVRTVPGTTVVLDRLVNKTTYHVWIKARNSAGSGDFSPYGRGIPWPENEIPAVPGRPIVIPGINQLTVDWEECGGASSYEVYINTSTMHPPLPELMSEKTSAIINNLENNVIYYFWVRSVNNAGKSDYSMMEVGTPQLPTVVPAAPGKPILIAHNKELAVSWHMAELAAAYEVWYGTTEDYSKAQKFGSDLSATETVISGLVNETVYYVWIRAKNIIGTSAFSPSASARPSAFAALPEIPAAITVVPGFSSLDLSWQAIEGALSYEVWAGVSNNASLAQKYGADVSGTYVTLGSLVNGTTYYIWIKAKNSIGSSNASAVVSAKPLGTPGTPVLTAGYKQISVSWATVAGADEYEVYYGIGTPTTLATTTTGTTATISGLTNGTTYHVRLRAKNANGVSEFGTSTSSMPSNTLSQGLYKGIVKIGNHNLSSALSYISSNSVSGDEFTIVLGANESIARTNLSYSGKRISITLLGFGGERTISLNSNDSMFDVYSGVTLILDENITLMGRNANNFNLIYVSGGNLIMNDGAKIRGNNAGSANGGGVSVYNGTFTMNGGEISGNTTSANGGGINVYGGTFTMNGGEISGNTTSASGGGIYIYSGTFTMNGGEISGNTASNGGGGICMNSGTTAIIHGGSISGNEDKSGYGGGGIFVFMNGTLTMYDGIISGNTAARFGGGVYVYPDSATFTMHGGVISGNTAKERGGGVNSSGIFKKLPSGSGQSSGIVYGWEAVGNDANGLSLKNTGNGGRPGDSIFCSERWRNTTAWETDHIDTTTGRGLSTSGNPPFGQ